MIKYIGSKRLIIPSIVELVQPLKINSACDLFTGTTRVAQQFKKMGYDTISNDLSDYSNAFGNTYISTNRQKIDLVKLSTIIEHLNNLPTEDGYFTETFCRQSRFFQEFNGMKIDAIRNEIEKFPEYKDILLTSLIEAADKVDSTTGVQMAYLKTYAKRSYNPLTLKLPELLGGNGKHYQMDANQLAKNLKTDLVYIDPPYNQHSYAGNYHIWDTLVKWDKPDFYGVACKRVDVKERKSDYNSKRSILTVFHDLISNLRDIPYILVSFNSEGYLTVEDISNTITSVGARKSLKVEKIGYKRYVGAQIGIHNQQGKKVGKVGNLKNEEYLFLGIK